MSAKLDPRLTANPFDVLMNDGSDDESSSVESVVDLIKEEQPEVGLGGYNSYEDDVENNDVFETSSDDDSAEYDDDLLFEAQLLDAQQQWEESLFQLNKVLNVLMLPLIGKFMGRRISVLIWKRVMDCFW